MLDQFTRALFSAIAHSTEAMVLSDPNQVDDPVIAANAAFEALTGYGQAEIIGRNCRFLQGPGTDRESVRRIQSSIAARQGCIEWIVNHRKDGAPFWNLLFLSPVFDETGALRYYFGNQLDISTGPPAWLSEVHFGSAHMPLQNEHEFHTLLAEIAAEEPDAADSAAERARGLERVVAAARRVSELAFGLAPGEDPSRAG